ncbi:MULTISPECIES: oxidoreductase [Paenibacillus]|uniref:oxidoreductase n=1 Tax=Paenibacillus TaxID=44249 RepID=UPI000895BE0E|nr:MULTISPECIES: oxidoreductase [unclassified Paenibacillus]SEB25816.1 NAD(P)H-binding [Paenibacillus sp. 276b]SLK08166.1 NAD(P)H-binding [Paenibacillus sp. RU5A]SOC70937.1 NAD(P)H-binding [Paenibacillus sp. RU26A]SOC73401.1 NAD(P)H-binding [Paenibacillus sp. RU5M]
MENHERQALVIGATGLVGGLLVRSLLQNPAYGRIRVLVRRPLEMEHPKLEQHVVDWEQLEEQKDLFRDVDDLYCCLGTTIKKAGSQENFRQVDFHYPVKAAKLAKEHGVSQMLVISSMGADAGSRVFYSRTKGEMEEALTDIGFRSLHIFRPSLILGDRKEKRLGEQLAAHAMTFLDRWMKGRVDKYRAIQASTIARAMMNIALVQTNGNHVYSNDVIHVLGLDES